MKNIIGTMILAIVLFLTTFSAYAEDAGVYNTDTLNEIKSETAQINSTASLPSVTIDDAESWIERKGFELIGLLQKFVQPFAIIIFILSAFVSLAGAFGNSQLIGRGILGMFIAVIMYAVVLYAPEILDGILGWLES